MQDAEEMRRRSTRRSRSRMQEWKDAEVNASTPILSSCG